MAAELQRRLFSCVSVTPGKFQVTRRVGESGLAPVPASGWHSCSAAVQSGRPPFSCPAVASGQRDVGSISINASPGLLRNEMAKWCFISAGSITSILGFCLHFSADELRLVRFTFYYLLKSPYTSKPHSSEDPSACLTIPLSFPCVTQPPVLPSLHGHRCLPRCRAPRGPATARGRGQCQCAECALGIVPSSPPAQSSR